MEKDPEFIEASKGKPPLSERDLKKDKFKLKNLDNQI